MKELSRSLSGVGKYAALVDGADDIPARVARKALGDGWQIDIATLRVKPLRVTARKGEDETVLAWAPSTGLKHLVWSALTASSEGDNREWVLCVTETFTNPTPSNEKLAHLRLGERCGLCIAHICP